MLLEVNFLAIFVIAILNLILGYIWYSPKIIGALFYTNEEKTKLESESPKPWQFIFCIIEGFILAWVFALVLFAFNPFHIFAAIGLAFLIWFGFFFVTHLSAHIWKKETCSECIMHSIYSLIYLIIASVILFYWI